MKCVWTYDSVYQLFGRAIDDDELTAYSKGELSCISYADIALDMTLTYGVLSAEDINDILLCTFDAYHEANDRYVTEYSFSMIDDSIDFKYKSDYVLKNIYNMIFNTDVFDGTLRDKDEVSRIQDSLKELLKAETAKGQKKKWYGCQDIMSKIDNINYFIDSFSQKFLV